MQRESDKHSPRLDDEMAHEVASLTHGAAAEESRAREDRTQEGPTEDELRFEPADRTLSQDRGIGIPDTDADARSELARHVTAADWPATRDDLLHAAQVGDVRRDKPRPILTT